MDRQQKELVVQDLRDGFANSKAAFLVSYKGLTVVQMQKLRSDLRGQGGRLQVAKGRLMKRAVQGVDSVENMAELFKDQIGLVFAAHDSAAVAKVLSQFAKENEALSLIAGCLGSHMIDKHGIVRIANLPSREVLLAQVCGGLKSPIAGFANVLNVLLLRLLWVLKEIERKKA